MSKYSGKCDFGDSWEIFGEKYILKSKVFILNNIVPLRIDSYKDALPYFPRIVVMSGGDKESSRIRLSDRSYADKEEENRLNWYLESIKKYYRKCKRKKVNFDIDEALDNVFFFEDKEKYKPLVMEVMKSGDKAVLPGDMHLSIYDFYRKQLYDDMVLAGYKDNEAAMWCFGWDRCCRKDVPEGVKVNYK